MAIFDTDLTGQTRTGTPGALEVSTSSPTETPIPIEINAARVTEIHLPALVGGLRPWNSNLLYAFYSNDVRNNGILGSFYNHAIGVQDPDILRTYVMFDLSQAEPWALPYGIEVDLDCTFQSGGYADTITIGPFNGDGKTDPRTLGGLNVFAGCDVSTDYYLTARTENQSTGVKTFLLGAQALADFIEARNSGTYFTLAIRQDLETTGSSHFSAIAGYTRPNPPVIRLLYTVEQGPVITDAGDESFVDGEVGVVIDGTTFGASQGSGVVEINSQYDGLGLAVQQSVTAWSDTQITVDIVKGGLNYGTNYLIVRNSSGQISAGYAITFPGPGGTVTVVATATATQVADGAGTAKLHAQYKNMAADICRSFIEAVPGSGPVLGVFRYNDVTYAFRNNISGTAALLYKSSGAGWVLVPMLYELSFTAGSGTAPAEGSTITQGTGQTEVSAVVKRVVLQSGSWGAGTAAGRFIIAEPTNGSFAAGAFTTGVTATCSGIQTAITLLPAGRYEFDIKNFGGQLDTKRVYGCDGMNRGFEFDGTVLVPIVTGMSPDTPSHVSVHKKHLFFSFKSSAQHSGIGTPYIWSPITGAAELAVGDTITSFKRLAGAETGGGSLALITKDSTNILYGNSSSDWNLVNYDDEQGAVAHTSQNIEGKTVSLDARGLTNLATTANYGNFISGSLSQRIHDWILASINKAVASCVVRNKSQYRLFFSDKYALYVTFNGGKIRGMMPILLHNDVTCIFSGENLDGSESIYFGSSNGFVYQMERGTSFDGEPIESYLHLAWNNSKNVRQRKHYKRTMFEVSGGGYSEFNFRYELGYGSTQINQPANQNIVQDFSPVFWDSFVWDNFVWDGVSLLPSTIKMDGDAENVSFIIQNRSDYQFPLKFSGCIFHYIPRRGMR